MSLPCKIMYFLWDQTTASSYTVVNNAAHCLTSWHLLDNHFNWIHSEAELLALGERVCDSAAVVCHLGIKVHPAARLRLCHQQDVDLRERTHALLVWHAGGFHCTQEVVRLLFLQLEWPCLRGHTWSDRPASAVRPLWQWRHSLCGWRWRSTIRTETKMWSEHWLVDWFTLCLCGDAPEVESSGKVDVRLFYLNAIRNVQLHSRMWVNASAVSFTSVCASMWASLDIS